jgi:phage terminase large subunit GpA-like protein
MIAPPWLVETISEWRPRPRLGGAEWAERERILSNEESPSPGPWRSIPWQIEILDALADTTLDWVVILKCAQAGVSELLRCAIGRWALTDPGDVLWVMTTEDAAKRAMKKLRAMFNATPSLRPLLSDRRSDSTLNELVLATGMRIVIGWAGSPQSLASDPFRYVVLDEVAKYEWQVKGEASPVDLAKERTKVYGRLAKIVLLSSPKHEDDLICSSHREVVDRRVFAVPCPSCQAVQPVEFSSTRWPGGEPAKAPSSRDDRARLADLIEAEQSAWIECRSCRGKILPHRAQYEAGAGWRSEADAPPGRRRAYHVPEFFHWETTISGLAAKFLRCMTPVALQGFWNGSLGLPYRSESSLIEGSLFSARATNPSRVVPSWATTVIATADTQLRGWWFMVRAWAAAGRSRLLDWGFAESADELVGRTLGAKFPVEGSPTLQAQALLLAIDTGGGMLTQDGSRTKETYLLIHRTPKAVAIKGEGNRGALQGVPWRTSRVSFAHEKYGERHIDLHLLNKNYYADQAAALIRCTEPVLWEECRGAENPVYMRQMASEEKVLVSSSSGSEWVWKKRSQGAENHMWDTARYQCWAAEFCRVEDRGNPTWAHRVRSKPDQTDEEKAESWLIGR